MLTAVISLPSFGGSARILTEIRSAGPVWPNQEFLKDQIMLRLSFLCLLTMLLSTTGCQREPTVGDKIRDVGDGVGDAIDEIGDNVDDLGDELDRRTAP